LRVSTPRVFFGLWTALAMCMRGRYYTQWYSFMRTNIVIDDRLMKQAMRASGAATKREVVERGLKTLIALKKQERIRRFRGKLKWDGDLDATRRDS
jgi:Arc/MetJ family transcription regulator